MRQGRDRYALILALFVLATLLVVNLPLFLCMPLAPDVNLYDLCARNVLRGGVHYRDVFDNNLPGIVWIHAVVRSVVGWRSEALRAFDFLVLAAIVWLLTRWLLAQGRSPAVQVWTAVALFAFYFSTSEWCHCQRDTWMLLPALLALHLRRIQLSNPTESRPLAKSLLEGLCWGAAFWIKPFVAVPAFLAWLASAVWCRRQGRSFGSIRLDTTGLLAGGLVAGGLGGAWLKATGAWMDFWDIFLNWNAEYYRYGRARAASSTLAQDFYLRSMPWLILHGLAVPIALVTIGRGLAGKARSSNPNDGPASFLLAVFYLGWLGQAVFLQNLADYVYVPPMLLAIAVLAGVPLGARLPRVRWVLIAGFCLLAAWLHPALRPGRLALWPRCWQEGSSPANRNGLALLGVTDWEQLDRVRAFLAEQRVQDGELVCFSGYTISLYMQLDVAPPMRYWYFDVHFHQYPRHQVLLREALLASRPRWVVSDLQALLDTWHWKADGTGPIPLPDDFPAAHRQEYPWSLPIVNRAGRYAVHEAGS
jgi:hypothetical protein